MYHEISHRVNAGLKENLLKVASLIKDTALCSSLSHFGFAFICFLVVVGARPIPRIVNSGICSLGVFCGRGRRLDSIVKESSPSPFTIPKQNWSKYAR
jgi:hypothetical protein